MSCGTRSSQEFVDSGRESIELQWRINSRFSYDIII